MTRAFRVSPSALGPFADGWFWNDPVAHSKVHKAVSGPQEGFQPAASSRTRTGRSWQGPGGARTAGLSGRAGAGLCFCLHASASSGLGLSRPVCHPLPLLSQPFFFLAPWGPE